MTKYILHGGRTGIVSEYNRKFFREILKDLKSPINILLVYFAREEDDWPRVTKEDIERFQKAAGKRKIKIDVAIKNLFELNKQIERADVVYIRGGYTPKLQGAMKKLDLKNLFKNKVIAGSSAGAYLISKYYYSNDDEVLREGLGLLPIKCFCHYTSQKNILDKLKKYKENLPLYKIPEQKFVVIKQ